MQFSKLAYFNRYITSYDFVVLLKEWRDVFLGAGDALSGHWVIIPMVAIPFALMILVSRIKINRSKYGVVVLFGTFACITVTDYFNQMYSDSIKGRLSIDNTLKTFSLFMLDLLRTYEMPEYKDYEIKNVGAGGGHPITVVYVMGESINAKHMSIFGYERETTPLMKKLSEKGDFYYTEGIAGGVCTIASSKFMANVIYEPNNGKLTNSCETSLCKLAKDNGFKVIYITSKFNKMITSVCNMSGKYMDVIETASTNKAHVERRKDDCILDLLDKQEFTDKNFIILHKRCAHTPYTAVFPEGYKNRTHFKNGKDKKVDEYDNAILYEDTWLYRVFNKFNRSSNGSFYIIYASDHNELLGENELYSHGYLHPAVADIPVIVQSNDAEFMRKFKAIYKPTHYEIAKMIAEVLGFQIKNPNEEKDVYYINGLDYNGRAGYIRLKKDIKNKKIEYELVN